MSPGWLLITRLFFAYFVVCTASPSLAVVIDKVSPFIDNVVTSVPQDKSVLYHLEPGPAPTLLSYLSTARPWSTVYQLERYCVQLNRKYREFGWGESPCTEQAWRFDYLSERGFALIYWEFIDEELRRQKRPSSEIQTTLILGGVHPDEITPVHMAFRMAQELQNDPSLYQNRRVVIAPLVNPDGFFIPRSKRTNLNGVDLNRNFPTVDWWKRAVSMWNTTQKRDPRRFPGHAPRTEQGTRFQMVLIEKYDVDQIISIHAPLGFLDYDGPGEVPKPSEDLNLKKARELVMKISENAKNFRIKDYPFFPGSLGNFSGHDLGIPTVTLELTSIEPKMVHKYWTDFYPGFRAAIQRDFRKKIWATLDKIE